MLKTISAGTRKPGLAMFAVAGFALSASVVTARAADDGAAPIWEGLGSIVGMYKPDPYTIDYRERSKLVVPPKMELPKPLAGPVNVDWPVDHDVKRARKAKELEDGPSSLPSGQRSQALVKPGATVTMSAVAGGGPGGTACLKDGVAVPCPDTDAKRKTGAPINWNPLTWVGIQKKPEVVLGPEPGRDSLIDPPSGYRAPVEGIGAKIQDN